MIVLNDTLASNRISVPSTPLLQKKVSSSSKDDRSPANRTFREVEEFNLAMIDDRKSTGTNPAI